MKRLKSLPNRIPLYYYHFSESFEDCKVEELVTVYIYGRLKPTIFTRYTINFKIRRINEMDKIIF